MMKKALLSLGLAAVLGASALGEIFIETGFGLPLSQTQSYVMTLKVGALEELFGFGPKLDTHFTLDAVVVPPFALANWSVYFGLHFGNLSDYFAIGAEYVNELGWIMKLSFKYSFSLPGITFKAQ